MNPHNASMGYTMCTYINLIRDVAHQSPPLSPPLTRLRRRHLPCPPCSLPANVFSSRPRRLPIKASAPPCPPPPPPPPCRLPASGVSICKRCVPWTRAHPCPSTRLSWTASRPWPHAWRARGGGSGTGRWTLLAACGQMTALDHGLMRCTCSRETGVCQGGSPPGHTRSHLVTPGHTWSHLVTPGHTRSH